MKHNFFLGILLFTLPWAPTSCGMCQSDSVGNKKPVKRIAKVVQVDKTFDRGWLYEAGADSVYLLQCPPDFGIEAYQAPNSRQPKIAIPAENISYITTKRNRPVLKGWLKGMAIGAAAGAILGAVAYTPPSHDDWFLLYTTRAESAAIGAVSGTIMGGGLGILIGAVARTRIDIGGNKQTYKGARESLRKKSLAR